MAYGRPMKNGTRRVPVTVHIPVGMLEIIDSFVQEQSETTGTAYSRSDFYNDAAVALLHSKGIEVGDDLQRTKSVTEKPGAKVTENNVDNTNKKHG